jgi:LmbE family N-acetylglucosaminyl deacetylase/CheY-like chemotaxis protein
MGGAPTASHILLVEDDEVLAGVVQELLSELGEVHWTTEAEDAIERVSIQRYDLVVSDIQLPGMNGIEFVRTMTERQPDLATLILSAAASFDSAVQALRAGADDYMAKPVDAAQLLAKARELIELTRERRAKSAEVVLAIGAHPDDVEIGVGGILARHVAEGDVVTILTLSGGEQGGVAADRANESIRAAAILGCRLVHADLVDTSVSEGGDTITAIKRVIDEIHPQRVYTHTARDVHQDHRNVHSATLVAARGIPRIYCYQAPSTTVEFHPTRYVAIDESYLERKLEAIAAFGSQTAVRAYLDPELLRATARYWARFTTARYVEPLEVIRESDISAPSTATSQVLTDV